jgi:hypothetical protein
MTLVPISATKTTAAETMRTDPNEQESVVLLPELDKAHRTARAAGTPKLESAVPPIEFCDLTREASLPEELADAPSLLSPRAYRSRWIRSCATPQTLQPRTQVSMNPLGPVTRSRHAEGAPLLQGLSIGKDNA